MDLRLAFRSPPSGWSNGVSQCAVPVRSSARLTKGPRVTEVTDR